MATRYTKTILKGYSLPALKALAKDEGFFIPTKVNKTTILRLLYSHFEIENDASIEAREMRLAIKYFDGFKNAVVKADKDTESVMKIMLHEWDNSFKIKFDEETDENKKKEFAKKLCEYCQKNGKEIKDCKPDYYARHYLFDQLSHLEKNTVDSRISHPLFEGLDGFLFSWILSARLEKILEGTYCPNPGSTGQNKEEFLIFRAYFTKKHEVTDHLWKIMQNCLKSMRSEHNFDKPTTKEEFVNICNRIRLSCQQYISSVITAKMSSNKWGSCKVCRFSADSQHTPIPTQALRVVYEDHTLNDSLEWELQVKELKIESLVEQLKLLQQEMEERGSGSSSPCDEMTEEKQLSYNDNSSVSCDSYFTASPVGDFSSYSWTEDDLHFQQEQQRSTFIPNCMDWEC